jgi:hypothetical protein
VITAQANPVHWSLVFGLARVSAIAAEAGPPLAITPEDEEFIRQQVRVPLKPPIE